MTETGEQPKQSLDDGVMVNDPIWGRNMFILGFITGCAAAVIVACLVTGPLVR